MDDLSDPSGFVAAAAARKPAEQTPSIVRTAMLATPQTICGILIHPLSLDTLWILEAVGHPLFTPRESGDIEMTTQQLAQLIFAFAAPTSALEIASQAADPSVQLTPFDLAAYAFIRSHVPNIRDLSMIGGAIAKMITEGLATAPGAGNPTTAATA